MAIDPIFGDDLDANIDQLRTYRKGETKESLMSKITEMGAIQRREAADLARLGVSCIEAGRPLPWEFGDLV